MGLLTDPGRSDKFAKLLLKYHTKVSIVVYVAGLCWLFALVDDNFNLKIRFSENALLPGLVDPQFSSENEAFAKKEYKAFKELQKQSEGLFPHEELKKSFLKVGMEVYEHVYNYTSSHTSRSIHNGRNLYAILRASRASSLESVVLTVPYRPANTERLRTEGGIALLLALAQQFNHKHHWAKDIIFLITDNEHIGAKAWVEAYHGVDGIGRAVISEPLKGRAGAIEAAIVLEIPGPEIDYLDVRLVGLNGQMPNMDLFTLARTLFGKQQIPLVIQGNAKLLDRSPDDYVGRYRRDLGTAANMVFSAASGTLEGNHGFFQQCNIQSLTVRGLIKGGSGGRGRIGFRDLGIALEGICRSLNNLLERFHQSYFFYILPSTQRFVSIGLYMPPLGLIVLPVVLKALALWAKGSVNENGEAGTMSTRSSTVGAVLPWLVLAHAIGFGTFFGLLHSGGDDGMALGLTVGVLLAYSVPLLISRFQSREDADLLQSITLIEMAVGLYALSMLNFPLSLLISIFSVPVCLSGWMTSRDAIAGPLRTFQAFLLFLSFPLFPLVAGHFYQKFHHFFTSFSSFEAIGLEALGEVSKKFLEFNEYGNWLLPVLFIFLLPLWISNWIVFWA